MSALEVDRNDSNAERASKWESEQPDKFDKYRNYVKNYDFELARAIAAQGAKQSQNRKAFIAWVRVNVGKVPNADDCEVPLLVEIAIVAAGMTKHGLVFLGQEYNRGKMDRLRNIPLVTKDLRDNNAQNQVRELSSSVYLDEKHVTHYVGLDVMLQLNLKLPVASDSPR